MVATSMHYIIGILIAYFLGYKDNRKYWFGLIAVIPDLDAIIFSVLFLGKKFIGYSLSFLETNQIAVVLFAHRAFSHSLLLLGIVILLLFIFKFSHKKILLVTLIWSSHFALDYLTSWKMFLLLPFSYSSSYIGLVEVFDSMLVFFTTIIFAFFIGMSILKKEKKTALVFSYLFVLLFGFVFSTFMREYNIQTILLSQGLFWIIVIGFYLCSKDQLKKKCFVIAHKGIYIVVIISLIYILMLFASKGYYALQLGTSLQNIEPLEQFAFNANAHTFEIKEGDKYRIGIITLTGIQKDKIIPAYIDHTGKISTDTINEYKKAYKKALHANWFNHPVFTFYEDEQGVIYANVRYAKSYLDTPYIPGPHHGMNVTLKNSVMVGYGRNWFS